MASKQHNKSKTTYKGQNIRRLPRSELEDNTMRDLNRFDNRLDHSLRSVDRAREVMLKSLESDRHIFMRGGVRSNKKYTVPIQNPGDSRQRREVTPQPAKYHSDTRNKRHPNETGYDVTNSTTGKKSEGQDRDILAETRQFIERQSGDELVDNFLSSHKNVAMDNGVGETKKASKSLHKQSTGPGMDSNHGSSLPNGKPGHRSSNTPTIKVDDYDGYLAYVNFDDKTIDGQRKSGIANTQPVTYNEDCLGRPKYDFWGYLSTPKNPSRSLQKREQLEREFSSPNLKARAATPATKSAKGPRGSSSHSLASSTTTTTTTTMTTTNSSSTTTKSPSTPRAKSAIQRKTTALKGKVK